jgi:hypothetical protein
MRAQPLRTFAALPARVMMRPTMVFGSSGSPFKMTRLPAFRYRFCASFSTNACAIGGVAAPLSTISLLVTSLP